MAGKQAGMGDALFINGVDLSGDTNSIDLSTPRDTLEVTGLPSFGKERILGQADASFEWKSYFNPALGAAHKTLGALPTTDVIVTYCRGTTFGNQACGMTALQLNYDLNRGDDGAFMAKVECDGDGYAATWGDQLTAGKATLGGAGTGTVLDGGAAGTTNFGLAAFLHVFAFTGTSATVAIQSSSDNGVGDPFSNITGAVFTAATAIGAQRLQTTATQPVERYLRTSVTGTFSNLVYAVMVTRFTGAWNL